MKQIVLASNNAGKLREFGQMLAKEPNAGTGIEDDELAIGPEFSTRSVAAVEDGVGARGGDGAANPPETQEIASGEFGRWCRAFGGIRWTGR